MTRSDYRRAAFMVSEMRRNATFMREAERTSTEKNATTVENFLVEFFMEDNPNFQEAHFREFCKPKL
jgi:hypothetical protein